MINGRTRLHVVANGTMTGQRYIDEVLLPHVRLFRGAVGDKFVFMDDNATCHRTHAVQDCLDREGIQRLVWPVRSPDLNPIENVWDALGRQFAGRNYPPTNKNTHIRALTEEWDKLPQQLLDNGVQKCNSTLRLAQGALELVTHSPASSCEVVSGRLFSDRPNPFPRPLPATIGYRQSNRSQLGNSSFVLYQEFGASFLRLDQLTDNVVKDDQEQQLHPETVFFVIVGSKEPQSYCKRFSFRPSDCHSNSN
ncbi:DDE_3 domain-containing protein [Trichonephila clavipes]|nr:DDE_3 domain-containing protein [Trichonephila clavipes]